MAERDRRAALLTGAVGGSLLTYFLTKSAEARAAPEGVDQKLWDMLLALLEAMDAQVASINNLIQVLGGTPAVPGEVYEDPFENAERFITGQVICTVINQGFQLPSFPIPKNKQLVVKALPGNIGWIYLSVTRAQSQSLTVAYMLVPNEGVGLFIKNSDEVWVCAPPAPIGALNDGVAFIVEQE